MEFRYFTSVFVFTLASSGDLSSESSAQDIVDDKMTRCGVPSDVDEAVTVLTEPVVPTEWLVMSSCNSSLSCS